MVRGGRSMKYQDAGRLVAGDHVYIFVSDRYPRLLDRLFASRAEVSRDDADFFGDGEGDIEEFGEALPELVLAGGSFRAR